MIIHAKKAKDPFSRILNSVVCDKRLSYRARGILCYLLSKPGNWQVVSEDVVNNGTEGRDSIRTCFKELKACGYAKLDHIPGGGSMWIICEEVVTEGLENGISRPPEKSEPLKTQRYKQLKRGENKNDGNAPKKSGAAVSLDFVVNKPDKPDFEARFRAIFRRREMSEKERSKFKKLEKLIVEEELAMVERYYAVNRKREDGYCRRDLYTFINHYLGEVDRARPWCEKHPVKVKTQPKPPKPEPEVERPPEDPAATRKFCEDFERHHGRLPGGYERKGDEIVFVGANGQKAS
jgi:hypothetical protein